MKIINRTTVPLRIEVYLFVPASATRAQFVLTPNQVQVLQFNDTPPASGSLSVYQVYRIPEGGDVADECLVVPAGATVVFSSEIQTGILGTN